MKNDALFPNIKETHETHVTRTTALVQISNANSQQFTSDNSNSTFRFGNTNSQQIANNDSNSTFNNAQLALQTKFRSHFSRSNHYSSVIQARSFYSLPDRQWRHMESSGKIWISASNRDIEKVIAFSGTYDLSPKSVSLLLKWSPRWGIQVWPLPGIPY
ncbi:hypothetical protein AVEN_188126-1 [Araneus ventricosus]|uniref:Uncharacterized protein n=1 Tax=Araneus ventricosus TaxID=182803 RepID=A0A4Y2T9M3_ARAVE|nr:hypothetical protein AVEN_69808-1 [Araneus ventricosus]GBN97272.1 hypothetical protein AVEN_188126-1 [Araneus ventricosus]